MMMSPAVIAVMLAGDLVCVLILVAGYAFFLKLERRHDRQMDRHAIERRESTNCFREVRSEIDHLSAVVSDMISVLNMRRTKRDPP